MSDPPISTWFGWLVRWVKDFLNKLGDRREHSILVLDTLVNDKTMAQLIFRNTPGSVASWRIVHQDYPRSQLLITLDNLFEIREFLRDYPKDTIPIKRTHLITIQWLIEVGGKGKHISKLKGCWMADLQGNSINAGAFDVIRYLVKEIVGLTPVAIPWDARIDKYAWEDTIKSKCKVLGDKHNPHLKKVRKPELINDATPKKK